MCSMLPFCILAGIRSNSVGVDTWIYRHLFNQIQNIGIAEAFATQAYYEPLFLLYSWVVAHLFHSEMMYLFFMQLAIVLPLVVYLHYEQPDSIGFGLFVYGCIYFGFTLNILRQSIAAAMLLFGWILLKRNRPIWCLAVIVISSGFHILAVVGILLYPVHYATMNGETVKRLFRGKQWIVLIACLTFIVVFFVLFGEQLIRWVAQFRESYSYQVARLGSGSIHKVVIGFAVVSLATYWVFGRKTSLGRRRRVVEPLAIMLLGAYLSLLSGFSFSLRRIGWVFWLWCSDYWAGIKGSMQSEKDKNAVTIIGVIACIVFFWWDYTVLCDNAIYPFVVVSSIHIS